MHATIQCSTRQSLEYKYNCCYRTQPEDVHFCCMLYKCKIYYIMGSTYCTMLDADAVITRICLTVPRSTDDSDPSNSKPLSMTTFSATGHSARLFGTAGSNRRSSLSPSNGSDADTGGGGGGGHNGSGKSNDAVSGGKAGVKNGPADRLLGGNKFQVG